LPAIRIDPAARTIEIEAHVALREGALELLLCHRGTKEYESILATDAVGSHLHAALLAVGLDPGRPGYWLRTPTGDSTYVPPAGAPLEISLRWRDDQGRLYTATPNQWLTGRETGEPAEPFGWVFVGSAPVEGPYWADQTGDIISLANYEASVIDVPFASSRDNERLTFACATQAIPPVGTPVTVVVHLADGAERAAVASAVIEIDRFGRYSLEGRPLTAQQAEEWAETFRSRHARPCIAILAAPQALAYDIDQLQRALGRSMIDDVAVHIRPPQEPILPRTDAQAAAALEAWRDRLEGGHDYLGNAESTAQGLLDQIGRAHRETTQRLKVWEDFRRQLGQMLQAYRSAHASEAPASAPAP
jgi:hypothetical protein